MTVVNWDPFREFDALFSRWASPRRLQASGKAADTANWRPVANIAETEAAYKVALELPAVDKADVQVTVQDGVLTVRGERRYEERDESEKYHRVESAYGQFSRSFSLPADADESGIEAASKDGLLTVSIPKVAAVEPKAIEVQVA